MFSRCSAISALLAISSLLTAPHACLAQHGHGAGHGGVHMGATYGGPGYYGGYLGGRSFYGYSAYPYYGGAYGYGYGYSMPGYYSAGYMPYAYGLSPALNSGPLSFYYNPGVMANLAPQAPVSATAGIRITVPEEAARVWFDGTLTQQTGTERQFQTPTLSAPGTYRIRAAWMQDGREVTREQDITVRPGQQTAVTFFRE
jgi:uncharacterized protein (TIGR03000 family)